MFEHEEQSRLRSTYQLCRLGFGTLSVALGLASITAVLVTTYSFTRLGLIREIFNSSWYSWIDTPITWASLLGATFLWGRWETKSWQRRTGFLMVMSLADVVLWAMDHANDLKIIHRDFGHEWLRSNVGQALGWAELALLSTLACDYLIHLGVGHVQEAAQSTRSLIRTGAVIWMLLFCSQTDWKEWPLQPGGALGHQERLLLTMGVVMIHTIVLIQVTALSILATRQSTRVLTEMEQQDPFHDFLDPNSQHQNEERYEVTSSRSRDGW